MKNLIISSLLILFSISLSFAQNIPQGMNYQAVARDADGLVLSEIPISIKITLFHNIDRKIVAYEETHFVSTNHLGLFNLIIGQGKSLSGDFEEIPWESEDIYVEIAMDENARNDFKVVNTTKLLTVPYAFHAGSAGKIAAPNPDSEGGRTPWWGQPWWNIEGLEMTNPDKHFIGNIDSVDLVFRTNNLERLRIKADGKVVLPGDVEIGGSLVVNGDSTIVQNLYVQGQEAIIDNNLNVGNNATIGNDISILNNLTTNGNGSFGNNVNIANDLTVGGDGTFFNIRALNNGTIGNHLSVENTASILGNTGIGNTIFSNARFNISSPSSMDYPFYVNVEGTDNTFSMNQKGQLFATSSKAGSSNNSGNFGFLLDSEDQGLLIRLNHDFPDSDNNYISFAGRTGSGWTTRGRIEGQTLDEHLADPLNIAKDAYTAAIAIAEGIAIGTALGGVPIDPSGIISLAAQLVLCDLQISFAIDNVGISYSSGSGDYAEWLLRKDLSEKTTFGDIIGVKGGQFTKKTDDADHLMVVSMSPIVLGNMPKEGEEHLYEKIAFMGQVPVKLIGKADIGDYILPSGQNDGFGIAVAPENMKIDDYQKIVGVSWSAKSDNLFGYVNVAVGINNNDIARTVKLQYDELSAEIDMIKKAIGLESDSDKDKETNKSIKNDLTVPSVESASSDSNDSMVMAQKSENHMQNLLNNEDLFYKSIQSLKDGFIKRGYDIESNPALKKLLTDTEYQSEILKQSRN